MNRFNTAALGAFWIFLLVAMGRTWAADEMSMMIYKGDLISVSTDSHTFSVKGSDQKEWEFTYNDKTEVSGAGEGIEGLAGKTGTPVTVHYKKEGDKNIATKIEVHSAQEY